MVKTEVSLQWRDVFDNGVAETCRELGIVISAHTPLFVSPLFFLA
jgi:pyridoxine 4-dehydrogenase